MYKIWLGYEHEFNPDRAPGTDTFANLAPLWFCSDLSQEEQSFNTEDHSLWIMFRFPFFKTWLLMIWLSLLQPLPLLATEKSSTNILSYTSVKALLFQARSGLNRPLTPLANYCPKERPLVRLLAFFLFNFIFPSKLCLC